MKRIVLAMDIPGEALRLARREDAETLFNLVSPDCNEEFVKARLYIFTVHASPANW